MKCLLVDDDPRMVDLLAKYVGDRADCQYARGGAEAVEIFRRAVQAKAPFDVVFMDILMPEVDGHEAVKSMRALEAEAGLAGPGEFRLVMTTSAADVKNVTKAFFRGYASGYLVKPFTRDKVLEALAQALPGARGQ